MSKTYCVCHTCTKYVDLGECPPVALIGIAVTEGDAEELDTDLRLFTTKLFARASIKIISFLVRHKGHNISILSSSEFNPRANLSWIDIKANAYDQEAMTLSQEEFDVLYDPAYFEAMDLDGFPSLFTL